MTDHYFGKALITRCDGHVKCYVLLTCTGLMSDHVHHGFVSGNATKLLRDALMDSGYNLCSSGWGQNPGYVLWKQSETGSSPHCKWLLKNAKTFFSGLKANIVWLYTLTDILILGQMTTNLWTFFVQRHYSMCFAQQICVYNLYLSGSWVYTDTKKDFLFPAWFCLSLGGFVCKVFKLLLLWGQEGILLLSVHRFCISVFKAC